MNKFTERMRILPSGFDEGWVLEVDGDIQSHVDLDDPQLIRFEYLRRIGNLLDRCWPAEQPIRVLHLGAGALTLARYVQATRPGSDQMVIELEPDLIDFVTARLPLDPATKLTTVTGDAAAALTDLKTTFDAIIVDIFTGHDTATHLAGADFYHSVLEHLTSAGLVVVNIGDDDGLHFLSQQIQVLHQAATQTGLSGCWVLAEATVLEHQQAGNVVLAAGPALPSEAQHATELATRLKAAGPYPARVCPPQALPAGKLRA